VLPAKGAMADQFWGDRCGSFTDPHGRRWNSALFGERGNGMTSRMLARPNPASVIMCGSCKQLSVVSSLIHPQFEGVV
jgi:hypothetical protein